MYKENSFYHSFIAARRIPLRVIKEPIYASLHSASYKPSAARHRKWEDVRGSRLQYQGKIQEVPLEGRSLKYVDGAYELCADDLVFKNVYGTPKYLILRFGCGELIAYHEIDMFDSRGGDVTGSWNGAVFVIGYRWP